MVKNFIKLTIFFFFFVFGKKSPSCEIFPKKNIASECVTHGLDLILRDTLIRLPMHTFLERYEEIAYNIY